MSALIYEIVWIRPLSLVFGTTTYAVSIIIAGFLSGLALVSWIAAKFSDKIDNLLKIPMHTRCPVSTPGRISVGAIQ